MLAATALSALATAFTGAVADRSEDRDMNRIFDAYLNRFNRVSSHGINHWRDDPHQASSWITGLLNVKDVCLSGGREQLVIPPVINGLQK